MEWIGGLTLWQNVFGNVGIEEASRKRRCGGIHEWCLLLPSPSVETSLERHTGRREKEREKKKEEKEMVEKEKEEQKSPPRKPVLVFSFVTWTSFSGSPFGRIQVSADANRMTWWVFFPPA